jgi:hypothetical protein
MGFLSRQLEGVQVITVNESEELLIDILELLGVDFVVQGEEHDEYHVALPSV